MLHALRRLPSLPVLVLSALLVVPGPAAGSDPSALSDERLLELMASTAPGDGRCGTPFVAELQARGIEWADAALAEGDTLYYDTAGGRFRVAYQVDGLSAVDPTDGDGSGVPDYVELTGSAFERSWDVEIDSLGFPAPELGGERYFVSTIFRGGFFGQTRPTTARPGGSFIEINHTMDSFCAVTDPPECPTNALLATVAHEFKHAIQIGSGWEIGAVGSWIELDASWVEDLVFDDSNDYYRFLAVPNSPFSAPSQSLVTTPSYQDCTWQHFLGESFGADFLVDFGDRILATQFDREPQLAYLDVADARGLDWTDLWGDYTVANYLTASRAQGGMGFEEGAAYPLALSEGVITLPWSSGLKGLDDLAMRFHVLEVADVGSGGVRINFSGSVAFPWSLRAVYQRPGETIVVEIPVEGGTASVRPPHVLEDFERFAVLVGNPRVPPINASSGTYTVSVSLEPISSPPTSVGGFKGRYRRPAGN